MTFRKRSTQKTTIFPSDSGAGLLRRLGWLAGAVLMWVAPLSVQAQAPDEGDPATALFRKPRVMAPPDAFRLYQETKPIAVSKSEFLSAGFLSGDADLPRGALLGALGADPARSGGGGRSAIQRFARVALLPPDGVTYAEGDSLLVVEEREAPPGYGSLMVPTGLVRVLRQDAGQASAEVVALYGPVRSGQQVVALPAFPNPGRVEPRPISDGVEGRLLVARDPRELRIPHQVLFIDVGRAEGVGLGDLFEARSPAGQEDSSGVRSVAAPLAWLRVVHLGEHTAAVKVDRVISAHLPMGTMVRQVAKLGN